ncbi:MAG: hypothetical protein WCI05_07115 [Myxococcales bacterium]
MSSKIVAWAKGTCHLLARTREEWSDEADEELRLLEVLCIAKIDSTVLITGETGSCSAAREDLSWRRRAMRGVHWVTRFVQVNALCLWGV